MKRIRVQATIDKDAASPDSIIAAQTFLTGQMFERATALGLALNWTTWRCHTRRRNGDLVLTQWARVIK